MSERTAGVRAARALLDFAMSKCGQRALLLERSGIDVTELLDEEKRIPFEQYAALMKAGQELSNDPAFALHFGESDEGMESTFACMMGIFSPTVAESFAHLRRDAPQMEVDANADDEQPFQMIREGDRVWIYDRRYDDFPAGAESNFARVVCASRRLFPGAEFVKTVHFKHAEPSYRAEYERIFQMPIVFGSERYALQTDTAWFELAGQGHSQQAMELMKQRVATLAHPNGNGTSMRSRVEAWLTDHLRSAEVSIDAAASELGVGRHTLLRKLKGEGVTFKQLLDELRRKLAMHYLNESKLPVSEAAYLLGFSDPSSFSRAYKRWTGHSPRSSSASLEM